MSSHATDLVWDFTYQTPFLSPSKTSPQHSVDSFLNCISVYWQTFSFCCNWPIFPGSIEVRQAGSPKDIRTRILGNCCSGIFTGQMPFDILYRTKIEDMIHFLLSPAVFLRLISLRLICCGNVSCSETEFSNPLIGSCYQTCVGLLTTFRVASDLFVLLLYFLYFVCFCVCTSCVW